ncbi:alanine--tRNA ligase [Acetobacteroides hydrogenigenes]|uniref:Alanine--tRNA ligase n=1 Tax=Acetobacteroides hydrogenigenes TaxID=979970 RepID=A0A4R2ELX3_9BACT|nr:alanine--tRNA ligase [Acetobacteroides hydrogenigenes]TCN70098.1 alanyl-tRNA synthetase [Acetobacteroides hydrogenigenes]
MNSNEIRKTFFDFFRSKQHEIVPSAPMVVKNDPTLMFTNAGMNQFKDIFLGNQPAKFPRVADSQKCLRVSGKHNDLEEVGHDTYHHTMFEMLGNWSFGDYFKEEAIAWAWELLTDVYKLPKDRLYASYFGGSKDDNMEADLEAFEIWKKYLPEAQILPGSKKDNFWEMGETGPCGPCSEIHIDLRDDDERAKVAGRDLVNKDNPLVIEIWNNVFMQFNRKANGDLELLPAKHVDTGMGFERLCMALQGKKSNYDTDVFQPMITKLAEMSGKKYGENKEADIAMRVIADHLRAIAFSIADGQLPSNVKAGYVIRRILRRAVRYGYTFLGFNEPFINKLIPTLVGQMGEQFPELKSQQVLIEKVITEEEAAFLRTLETGIRHLDSIIEKAKAEGKNEIDGKTAFVLNDTFGFPYDLTELIAREKGFTVDKVGFEKELEEQKNRSRNAAAVETDDWVELRKFDTEEFIGYDHSSADVVIARYRAVKSKNKTQYQLVFDRTPFYGESGGQVGDSGYIESESERINIIDTVKENNLIVHITDKLPQDASANFHAVVNEEARTATANNHSATHLLHFALRQVLGTHVEQKGSLVRPDGLRFDFAHFQKVTDEEIKQVERIVNELIRKNTPLNERREAPIEEAQKMGAMALFGEKYGDKVRVIQFGESVELCGGTHVPATGQIGIIKITSESAIAAGVRRIEAVTAKGAEELIYGQEESLKEVKALLNNPANLSAGLKKLIDEAAELRKTIDALMREKVVALKGELKAKITEVNGVKVLAEEVALSPDAIKDLAFQLKGEHADLLIVIGAVNDGKPSLTVAAGDALIKDKGVNAGQIIREAAKEIQGGGGGQPFFAQAGGKNAQGIAKAIAKAVELGTK